MNGYIIETRRSNKAACGRTEILLWIGISASALMMLAIIKGHSASLVDHGPDALHRARAMGLQEGEVRQLDGEVWRRRHRGIVHECCSPALRKTMVL